MYCMWIPQHVFGHIYYCRLMTALTCTSSLATIVEDSSFLCFANASLRAFAQAISQKGVCPLFPLAVMKVCGGTESCVTIRIVTSILFCLFC